MPITNISSAQLRGIGIYNGVEIPAGSGFSNTKSLLFGGVDDYVLTSPTYSATDGLLDFAYSFWLKFDDLSSNQNIFGISNQPQADARAQKIQCYWNVANSRLQVYFDNLSYYCRTDATLWTPVVDTWYHVLLTRAQSRAVNDKCRLYINGINCLHAENTRYHLFNTNATSGIYIGDNIGLSYSPFAGNIDEFAFYTQDMAAYISEIYSDGTPDDLNNLATAPAPDVWYRMGENSTFSSPQILMPENTNKDKLSNYSFAFDGLSAEINCGADSSLQPTSSITLSTWFMIPTADLHYGADTLISQDHVPWGGLYNGYYMEVTIAANGYLYSKFGLGNGTSETSVNIATDSGGTPPYVGDTWYNLVGTWDGSDMTLYINGVSLGTTAFSGPITYDASQETFIGNRGHGQSDYFVGNIDEVSMFNSAKAIGDIWDGSGKPTDLTGESGLVSWWRMGEKATFSTNWTVPDEIGSNTGTSANMTIEDRTGDAPDSSNNALSYNMDAADIVTDTP